MRIFDSYYIVITSLNMSEDHQRDRDNNQEKKKTRRTRKDQQGRNFSCPCGKSYLSYPALYTHIKTKHYGKAPKQNVLAAQAQPQVEPQPQCLMNIKEMLQKNFPNDGIRFGVLLTTNEEAYIASIMSNQEESDKDRFEDIVNNKNQTINNIFGKFLCQMKKLVKGEAFVYLCQLIAQFQMLIVEEKKDQDYCRTNNGALLPYYFNDLISKKRVPAVKHFFEPNSNHLSVGCKVLYNFGVWLFEQKYSNFSIKYNTV